MWVLKRVSADYYYERYDHKSDLPIYTNNISKAKTYRTKREAKADSRFGDTAIKVDK